MKNKRSGKLVRRCIWISVQLWELLTDCARKDQRSTAAMIRKILGERFREKDFS